MLEDRNEHITCNSAGLSQWSQSNVSQVWRIWRQSIGCDFWPKYEWLFGIRTSSIRRIPLVSFLDPVVSISEPVKLQADNDADIANLKALWSCYIVLFNVIL